MNCNLPFINDNELLQSVTSQTTKLLRQKHTKLFAPELSHYHVRKTIKLS